MEVNGGHSWSGRAGRRGFSARLQQPLKTSPPTPYRVVFATGVFAVFAVLTTVSGRLHRRVRGRWLWAPNIYLLLRVVAHPELDIQPLANVGCED